MVLLLLSLAALLVGPVVERLARRAVWTEAALDGFVLTALVGLILLHILPHNVEIAGLWAFAAAGVGFLVPLLLERRLHDHGGGAGRLHRWLLVAGFLGYAVHASLDGLALATGHDDHGTQVIGAELLGIAVVLHRIPVGLAIWWLLRPTVGPLGTLAMIATIATSTVIGFGASSWLLQGLERPAVGLLQALVAGSLLHVALHPAATRGNGAHQARASAAGGLLAVVVLLGVARVHPMAQRFAEEISTGAAFRAFYLQAAPALLVGLLISAAWSAWRARPDGPRGTMLLDGVAECSCQGLPRYRLLLQSAGAARAHRFLIATTELGLVGLIPSWALLGGAFTAYRLAGAGALLLLVGWGLAGRAPAAASGPDLEVHRVGGFSAALAGRIDHAVPWILLGLGVAAFVEPLVSAQALATDHPTLDVLLWGALGFPVYLCSAAATPIAAVLLHKGLPPGAALALLLTGPAVSLSGLGELARAHRPRHALLYGLIVYGVAVAAGLSVQVWGTASGPFDLHGEAQEGADLLSGAAGAILALLMLLSLLRQGVRGFAGQILGTRTHDHGEEPDDHGHGHHDHDHAPTPTGPASMQGGFRFHGAPAFARGRRAPLYLGLPQR